MRLKIFVWAVVAIITGAGLAGCSKKNETTPQGTFSFRVGDVTYHSNSTQGYISDTVIAGKKTLIIDGVTNNFTKHMELMITFPNGLQAGQYDQSAGEMTLMDIQQKEDGYITKAISIKLESINSKQAEGTFSGTLISGEIEKPLTDGTFKVYF
ncbi:hypothetical protein [Chitinophaga varians]|uniref:hypothetical protein n=1 Tax=Chitinophaga varians TaxID=2202339 RepID=UPI00165F68E2|nr:hypothetical protein [Chitinophaga varians]MBC9911320.1 hypothetical protein [Chitinophaga varians]